MLGVVAHVPFPLFYVVVLLLWRTLVVDGFVFVRPLAGRLFEFLGTDVEQMFGNSPTFNGT